MASNADSGWWWEDANTAQGTTGVQIVVMDDAGKPVFSSFPHCMMAETKAKAESQTTKFCGMIQALRSVLLFQTNSGDIQSVVSEGLRVVFLSKGALTFIAISPACLSDAENDTLPLSEMVLRLHLEHLYSKLVFQMTEPRVQACIKQDSAIDWSSLLSCDAPTCLLTTSVPICFPIPQTIRHQTSLWLQKHAASDYVFYVILCHQKKIVTLVQPDYSPHQLHATDLNLLLVACTGTTHDDSQRWFSVCLPRLDASATLQCCVTQEQNFTLILLTPSPDREAAVRTLARSLLPPFDFSDIGIDDSASSEDYELVPHPRTTTAEDNPAALKNLQEMLAAKKDLLGGITVQNCVEHFFFRKRFDVQPARKRRRRGKSEEALGCVYQSIQSAECTSSDLKAYHELCFRLRFGSSEFEAGATETYTSDSLVMLLEPFPSNESICYDRRKDKIHLAMNGKDFELYV